MNLNDYLFACIRDRAYVAFVRDRTHVAFVRDRAHVANVEGKNLHVYRFVVVCVPTGRGTTGYL